MLQSVLGETVHAAKDALAGNKKVADVKKDFVEQTNKTKLTSDFGVKEPDTDNWLSASTNGRQGPLLLEDNFAREKVCLIEGIQIMGYLLQGPCVVYMIYLANLMSDYAL